MGPSGQRRAALVAMSLVVALALVTVAVALASERAEGPRVSALVFPARLVQHLENPAVEGETGTAGWKQPSAITVLEGRRFVLDSGNDRILELDGAGIASSGH